MQVNTSSEAQIIEKSIDKHPLLPVINCQTSIWLNLFQSINNISRQSFEIFYQDILEAKSNCDKYISDNELEFIDQDVQWVVRNQENIRQRTVAYNTERNIFRLGTQKTCGDSKDHASCKWNAY